MTRRVIGRALVALALVAGTSSAESGSPEPYRLRLFTDTDDDDRDGRPDRDAKDPAQAADVVWFEASPGKPFSVKGVNGGPVRVIAGRGVVSESSVRAQRVGLQGTATGEAVIDLGERRVHAFVCDVFARDMDGRRVDLAASHASLSRTLPPALAKHADGDVDRDALTWGVVCPLGAMPHAATVTSFRPDGVELDSLEIMLEPEPCPRGTPAGHACGKTAPVRAAVDAVDRSHPSTTAGSVRAEVGGLLSIGVEGREAASIRVGGPRETEIGAIGRFRGALAVHVLRMWPGGAPAVGGTTDGAIATILREVHTLDAIWGQCGVVFSPVHASGIAVIDPPPSHLIAVGCETALPASGGRVSVAVEGTEIDIVTKPRETPLEVAHRMAERINLKGFVATVSPNARTVSGALRTADILVKNADGRPARVARGKQPLSTDSTLGLCIGEVDLSDGLDHFGDLNAVAGTLEERTLIKALQDDDPTTIDAFIIGSFSRTGRIGESFIDADRSSIQNALVLDRAGIRAGARSYAFAHELGHILLDMPGHPDDFGIDRPWMLMDADAADPTIFGPRRLPTSECERALRQSGPGTPVPLLQNWSLLEANGASRPPEAASPDPPKGRDAAAPKAP